MRCRNLPGYGRRKRMFGLLWRRHLFSRVWMASRLSFWSDMCFCFSSSNNLCCRYLLWIRWSLCCMSKRKLLPSGNNKSCSLSYWNLPFNNWSFSSRVLCFMSCRIVMSDTWINRSNSNISLSTWILLSCGNIVCKYKSLPCRNLLWRRWRHCFHFLYCLYSGIHVFNRDKYLQQSHGHLSCRLLLPYRIDFRNQSRMSCRNLFSKYRTICFFSMLAMPSWLLLRYCFNRTNRSMLSWILLPCWLFYCKS